MPKIIIHAPHATFDAKSKCNLAKALTDFALECEKLPHATLLKSSVWIFFNEYPAGSVFMGADPASKNVMSLHLYALAGGLDADAKTAFVVGATEILGRHANCGHPVPAHIVINEIAEGNWGTYGKHGNLEALRATAADAASL